MTQQRRTPGALAAVATVAAVAAVASTTLAASPAAAGETGRNERAGQADDLGTYADFSRLTERSAGQFGSGGSIAGQWSWRTDAPGEYSITWDQERPENRERFLRSDDGEWLLLDGWGMKGVEYYEQRITSESIGDADCTGMEPIPSDGDLQHYVRWDIPAEGYCLDARGTIVEEDGGPEITFRHRQVWSPPAPCANSVFPDRVCITQHETWWDDNGHPYQQTLDREIRLARGLGMAFTIEQSFPQPWSSELVNVWDY
ncbi:hypothetical protein [Streptomyces johnsoniae]|uniref:Uncharacterized protein n=1 Tax=Streptomyces johnsoniae TaxID=3075532 RepID=A0ABU2SCH2_9ACTN|nr:hypothetical protein [Streptomyces sp. DSM 41886]MDT0446687.1 hypothetical protein [Streptomyces sp. DSM 41886]